MKDALFYLAIAGCFVTAGILIYGVTGFGRGLLTPRQQNRLMRYRIAAQFVAVILALVAAWAARG